MKHILLPAIVITGFVPSVWAAELPVHECDRLATQPVNLHKVVTGVPWNAREAQRAIPACAGALEAFPKLARLQYQYSRALRKIGSNAEAVKWFHKAAEHGLAEAQNNLTLMDSNGKRGLQDYAKAAKWYREAAKRGHPKGQRQLGSMSEHGLGVAKDYTEALKWYHKAAAQGDDKAARKVAEFQQIAKKKNVLTVIQVRNAISKNMARFELSYADRPLSISGRIFRMKFAEVKKLSGDKLLVVTLVTKQLASMPAEMVAMLEGLGAICGVGDSSEQERAITFDQDDVVIIEGSLYGIEIVESQVPIPMLYPCVIRLE